MKCPGCYTLNAASDEVCARCHRPLRGGGGGSWGGGWKGPPSGTPTWAYLFAGACGLIPVVALGGLVPIALGFGGAGGCLSVARASSVPVVLRMVACLVITLGCWALFGLLIMAVVAATQ